MPAAEVDVSPDLARRLLVVQHPDLAHLPIEVWQTAQHAVRALARCQMRHRGHDRGRRRRADEAETARALEALAARISAAGPETAAARRARSSATARTGGVPAGPLACVARPADPELAPVLVGLGVTSLSMAQRAVADVRLALAATRSPTAGASPSWRWPTDAAGDRALVRDDPPVR